MKQPFEKVVAQHGATVLRVCRAVVGVHDADDAWSETFLAALGAWPELPADANVEAWLVTIAHRKAIDIVRSRRRQPLAVAAVEQVSARASGAATSRSNGNGHGPAHAADATGSPARISRGNRSQPGHPDHDAALDLWQAVGALPEKQRLAVAYHYLGGLAFAEVAAIVGGSVEAARRASSDGVRALRATYARLENGPAGHPLLHTEGSDR